MISLRFAVPAALVVAVLAVCFTYFVPPRPPVAPPPQLPEKMPELHMGIPASVDPPKAQETADDFLQAAQAILKKEASLSYQHRGRCPGMLEALMPVIRLSSLYERCLR